MDADQPLAATPLNALLGLVLRARDERSAVLELPARPEFAQEAGVVHGGILATLADSAAVHLLLPRLPAATALTSIEFKVNFLAPAAPGGPPLLATATLLRLGGSVAVCETVVAQGDRLCCKGTFTYLLRQGRAGAP